jgi:hypothetical protein
MDNKLDKRFIAQGKTKIVNASVLAPENAGLRFILNVVGQDGKFTSPLSLILAKRWAKVKEDNSYWYATQMNFKLGSLNETAVSSDTWAISMLVQDKTGKVDQKALQAAIKKVSEKAKYEKASVHVSTLLTSAIPELQDLLIKGLVEEGVSVYFYNEPTK